MHNMPGSGLARAYRGALPALALAISFLVFAPRYIIKAASVLLPPSIPASSFWFLPVGWAGYLADRLLSSTPIYVGLSLLGLLLIVAALVQARPRWPVGLALWLAAAAIIAYPWVTPYLPAVAAVLGFEMRWLTRPGLLAGTVKTAQIGAEIKPCSHALLGWTPDGMLYYTQQCRDGRMTTFQC